MITVREGEGELALPVQDCRWRISGGCTVIVMGLWQMIWIRFCMFGSSRRLLLRE